MGHQAMPKFNWNGQSVNAHIQLEWGINQCPNVTRMGKQSMGIEELKQKTATFSFHQ